MTFVSSGRLPNLGALVAEGTDNSTENDRASFIPWETNEGNVQLRKMAGTTFIRDLISG